MAVYPAQCGVTVGGILIVRHHDPQRADVIHLLEPERLAAHLFDNAVDVFRPPLHRAGDALPHQRAFDVFAQLLHIQLPLGAFFIQQLRNLPVHLGLQETKGQVFHLPFDLPNAQPVGQGREYLQRFARHSFRRWKLGGGKVAQCLQARGQAQQHHAQVARKGQQHFAHVFHLHRGGLRQGHGLPAGGPLRDCLRRQLRRTGLALHFDQFVGLNRQRRKVVAKGFGNDVLRFVQVLAGVHQVGAGLHFGRAANALQDGGNRIRMGQGVFAGVELLLGDQWLGEGPGAGECIALLGRLDGGGRQQLGAQRGFTGWRIAGFHGAGPGLSTANTNRKINPHEKMKSTVVFTWSVAMSVGACPTPSNSTRRALGPRCVI